MNKSLTSGRLTKDAELSYIASTTTPKLNFTLAVERSYQKDKNNKKVDFISYEMLGARCENLCQYLTKGKMILVEGELNIDKYQDQEGNQKSFTKIKVDRLEFVGSNGNSENKNNDYQEPSFDMVDDDSIPF